MIVVVRRRSRSISAVAFVSIAKLFDIKRIQLVRSPRLRG